MLKSPDTRPGPSELLVEGGGATECAVQRRNVRYVPARQIAIEDDRTVEHVLHRGYLACVPANEYSE